LRNHPWSDRMSRLRSGVAIGFAFPNILQNFSRWTASVMCGAIPCGDEMKIDAFEGRVDEIQARATIIKTYAHPMPRMIHAMLRSYDQVLTAVVDVLDKDQKAAKDRSAA
jgi:hypothetical protein